MSRIFVLSLNSDKINAVKHFNLVLDTHDCSDNLIAIDVNDHNLMPKQPVGFDSGLNCAFKRIELFKQKLFDSSNEHSFDENYDVIISIENFIDTDTQKDICCVVIQLKGIFVHSYSDDMFNPTYPNEQIYLKELGEIKQLENMSGYDTTIGSIIEKHKKLQKNSWHEYCGSFSRRAQIINAIRKIIIETDFVKQFTRIVENHPQPGIRFSDLSTVVANGVIQRMLLKRMVIKLNDFLCKYDNENYRINYVVGLDARGFIFGTLLSSYLKADFVPMRKKGKLGGSDCYSESYGKEYGVDCFEIIHNIMRKKSNILIVDDIIATGGTILAAKKLCENYDPTNITCLVVDEIKELKNVAKEKLGDFYNNLIICM